MRQSCEPAVSCHDDVGQVFIVAERASSRSGAHVAGKRSRQRATLHGAAVVIVSDEQARRAFKRHGCSLGNSLEWLRRRGKRCALVECHPAESEVKEKGAILPRLNPIRLIVLTGHGMSKPQPIAERRHVPLLRTHDSPGRASPLRGVASAKSQEPRAKSQEQEAESYRVRDDAGHDTRVVVPLQA